MTANQINYQRNLETTRHNLVTEAQGWSQIAEVHRHNVVTEQLGFATLAETTRHNKATEAIGFANITLGYAQLNETRRHNIASESLGWANYSLGVYNAKENARHNKQQEAIGWKNANISLFKADTERLNAQFNYALGYGRLMNDQKRTRIERAYYKLDEKFKAKNYALDRAKASVSMSATMQELKMSWQSNARDWISLFTNTGTNVGKVIATGGSKK